MPEVGLGWASADMGDLSELLLFSEVLVGGGVCVIPKGAGCAKVLWWNGWI